VVTLFDVGTSPGGPYLVMELLRGETLAQRLAGGPVPLADAVHVARQVARGLAHAHGRGVLHRDLKPANIFLCDDGRVKLLDFGLAHLLGRGGSQGSGTPGYMAPEQQRGEDMDARADVYSAAVTLREMVTGRRAAGPDGEEPVPSKLARLLARATSPDREERPRDGTAWLEEVTAVQVAVERPKRLRRVGALVLAGLVAGGSIAALVVRNRQGSDDGPPALAPDGRTVVAVADVANGTGETELDAISGLLVTSLEQSRKLILLTRGRLADVARQLALPGGAIDEVSGRKVGRRAGASILLVPSIHRLGTTYVVELRALDLRTERYRFTLKETATSQEALVPLVDRLSDRARQELRETPAEVAESRIEVSDALTHSLEAYEHYLKGRELRLKECDNVAAEREQRVALELDPDFGAAHMELGLLVMLNQGRQADSDVHLTAARKLTARLPEKERRIVELDELVTPSVPVAGDRTEQRTRVLQGLDELVSRYPADEYVLYWGGWANYALGDWETALDYYRRSLEIDPGQCYAAGYAGNILRIRLGRPTEALPIFERAAAARPNAMNRANLALALVPGHPRDAARQAREALRLANAGQIEAVATAACALLEAGSPGEATAAARNLAVDGDGEFAQGSGRGLLAAVTARVGRPGEALREYDRIEPRRIGPFYNQRAVLRAVGSSGNQAPEAAEELRTGPSVRFKAGQLALYGDLVGAAASAATLAPESAEFLHYQAVRAALERRWGEAVPALRALIASARAAPGGTASPLRATTLEATSLLGLALLEQGDAAAALDVLSAADSPGTCSLQGAVLVPAMLVTRARAHERLGQLEEARKDLDRLLSQWKEAEPGLPLHANAKAMRERLGAPASR
jgi:serine/threonine protein kinase